MKQRFAEVATTPTVCEPNPRRVGQTGVGTMKDPSRSRGLFGSWSAPPFASNAVRWGAAIVFVVFGAGKFVNHASELASFRFYGLPAPEVFVDLIGALELLGGLMLAAGRGGRPRPPLLPGGMVRADGVSRIRRGRPLHPYPAPPFLPAKLYLPRVWRRVG